MPFFGICLGHADGGRRVRAQRASASTAPTRIEFDETTPHPVVDLMADQKQRRRQGRRPCGSGAYPCTLKPGHARRAELYGAAEISERHRHRFEFNNDYREQLERQGMVLSGTSPDAATSSR